MQQAIRERYRVWKWGLDAGWGAESAGLLHFGQSSAASPHKQSSWRDEISLGRKGTDMQSAEADRDEKKMQSRVNTIYSKIWTTKRVIVWSYGTFKELTFCDFLHPSTITSVLLTCSPAKWACKPVNEATVQHSLQKEGEFHLGWRTHTHTELKKKHCFVNFIFCSESLE